MKVKGHHEAPSTYSEDRDSHGFISSPDSALTAQETRSSGDSVGHHKGVFRPPGSWQLEMVLVWPGSPFSPGRITTRSKADPDCVGEQPTVLLFFQPLTVF